MYEIIENYNGKLFRVYETLEQAEMFCNKFKGYHFSKVETQEELKEETIMENEETKLLAAHTDDSEVGGNTLAPAPEVPSDPVSAPEPVQE